MTYLPVSSQASGFVSERFGTGTQFQHVNLKGTYKPCMM